MNKLKSLLISLMSFALIFGISFFLSGKAESQTRYNIKLNLNGKQLFTDCCSDEKITFVYIPLEELAKAVDPSFKIAGPFELGPYFKIEGTKLSAIKTGSGDNARLNINKTGLISSGVVEIVFQDGKKHTFIELQSFVSALGGTWKYNESSGIYEVTAGGCGACFINEQ
jgi:hypothetical protein